MCKKRMNLLKKTPCMAACPAEDGSLDGSINDQGNIESVYYDRERCASRAMNFGPIAFQKVLADLVTEDDAEVRKNKVTQIFSEHVPGLRIIKKVLLSA